MLLKARVNSGFRKWVSLAFATAIALAPAASDAATPRISGRTKPKTTSKRMYILNPDGTKTALDGQTKRAEVVAWPYEWRPDLAPHGPVELMLVLNEQRIYVYRSGILIGYSTVSTGREGYNTPAGQYTILQKVKDHKSNQFGSFVDIATGRTVDYNASANQTPPPGAVYKPAPMPYFQRLTWGGIGLHEGFLPGYPDSHGCIRVHADMAHRLFEVTSIGTRVWITYDRPPPRAVPVY